jgi:pyrroline-5-carboxylate reductase
MRIGLIGAGSMASALARGWGEPVLVADVVPERAQALADEIGGTAVASAREVAQQAELVVLCHKPPQLAEVAAEAGTASAVASILAGVRLADLEAAYPQAAVYRFIPNIPVEVRAGVLCYTPGTRASEGPEAEVRELFGRLGTVFELDEPLIEPAMALMSCGPAFLALFAEDLVEAGARHGLDREEATRMVAETMGGTAAWLREHDHDAAALRTRVATPGGLTERGLEVLEREGLHAAVDTVVEGATA